MIGKILEQIFSARELDFKCSKNDPDYVELGGSNKICTFKIWYHLAVLKKSFLSKYK